MFKFFDRLEDKVRERLSRYPLTYSLIGGVSIVLFWRGVWLTADQIPLLTGPISVIISLSVLLITGLFVSFFVGDAIIMSGIKGDKKLIEKAEGEVSREASLLKDVEQGVKNENMELQEIRSELSEIKQLLRKELL